MTYFNENDAFAARWLRNLYPSATVDERSIKDVQPADVVGFDRCHFFGGIGGWEYALHLAGWPGGREVWTGSCPCQPFSAASPHRTGTDDTRNLWPEFFRLIRERRPSVLFGEQVGRTDGVAWLARTRKDLEDIGYAVGCADMPAISVGAKHFRYRLWFVAHTSGKGLERVYANRRAVDLQPAQGNVSRHEWKATPRVLQRVDGFSRKLDKPHAYRETIRCYGNAIVPQMAAVFIRAFMET